MHMIKCILIIQVTLVRAIIYTLTVDLCKLYVVFEGKIRL